jgi:hypothetical protein
VMLINDNTRLRIYAAPEAETHLGAEQFALGTACHQCLAESDEFHAIAS